MRIRKGKSRYKLPPIGELLGVNISEKWPSPTFRLIAVRPNDPRFKDKKRGIPQCFAVTQGPVSSEITLWPVPDKAATLTIRYYPPAQEI